MGCSRILHNVGNVALINVHSVHILCTWLKFTSNKQVVLKTKLMLFAHVLIIQYSRQKEGLDKYIQQC